MLFLLTRISFPTRSASWGLTSFIINVPASPLKKKNLPHPTLGLVPNLWTSPAARVLLFIMFSHYCFSSGVVVSSFVAWDIPVTSSSSIVYPNSYLRAFPSWVPDKGFFINEWIPVLFSSSQLFQIHHAPLARDKSRPACCTTNKNDPCSRVSHFFPIVMYIFGQSSHIATLPSFKAP